jgi:hypothetical protein
MQNETIIYNVLSPVCTRSNYLLSIWSEQTFHGVVKWPHPSSFDHQVISDQFWCIITFVFCFFLKLSWKEILQQDLKRNCIRGKKMSQRCLCVMGIECRQIYNISLFEMIKVFPLCNMTNVYICCCCWLREFVSDGAWQPCGKYRILFLVSTKTNESGRLCKRITGSLSKPDNSIAHS